MRLKVVAGVLLAILLLLQSARAAQIDDSDEFVDFDDEETTGGGAASGKMEPEEEVDEQQQEFEEQSDSDQFADVDEEVTIESEDEFSHLEDDEEFVGFTPDGASSPKKSSPTLKKTMKEPHITIANVPLHLRSNWDSYYLELILVTILLVYFTNFSIGRTKNFKLAHSWYEAHKGFLVQQFALVGDDLKAIANGENGAQGEKKSVITSSGGCVGLQKDSENIYTLYCSGRVCVHSMNVELRLIKRQDLASLLANIFRPSNDEVIIKIRLDDMESFVMCLAAKKVLSKYAKEMSDLGTFCPGDRKSTLPAKLYTSAQSSKYAIWSEIGEASQAILSDQKVVAILNKHLHRVNYLHISDQYTGPKISEQDQQQPQASDGSTIHRMAEVHKMVILSLRMHDDPKNKGTTEDVESLKPLMMLALYLADKMYRFRLSKEAKAKAVRNRAKVEEAFHKANHLARTERAQELREEKKREAREKMLECDDEEKQRKWEERENKKAAKRRAPKMKKMKVG